MSDAAIKLALLGPPIVLIVSTIVGYILGEMDRRRDERAESGHIR